MCFPPPPDHGHIRVITGGRWGREGEKDGEGREGERGEKGREGEWVREGREREGWRESGRTTCVEVKGQEKSIFPSE